MSAERLLEEPENMLCRCATGRLNHFVLQGGLLSCSNHVAVSVHMVAKRISKQMGEVDGAMTTVLSTPCAN